MEVIAKTHRHTKGLRHQAGAFFALGITMLSLSGCVAGGMDFLSAAKVDRSVATGTVPQETPSTDTLSDEMTVRNAVTSADIQRLEGQPLPWANASTGSAGVIETIVENNEGGQVCRQFRTTRHSYVGIAKFYGKTCLLGAGNWQLLSFQQES
ncbi:RT0821/Lpp0805 family surface protein [Rhizobium binxianense]